MIAKELFSIIFFILISLAVQSQNFEGLYQTETTRSRSSSRERAYLQLNKNGTFQFKHYIDQSDYFTEHMAHGSYKLAKGSLKLFLADDIRPIVSVKKNGENYIKFYFPPIYGVYAQVFNKDGKQIQLLDFSKNTIKLPFSNSLHKVRIIYNKYEIANLTIDEPCDIYISNVQSKIAYYVETYSFTVKPKKIVGKLTFYWWGNKPYKRKLIFNKLN